MPTSEYSYPASGGFQLQTSGGLTGGGGFDDMAAFYKQMAERRMAEQAADRSRRNAREDWSFQQAKDAAQQAKSPLGAGPNADDQRFAAQMRQLQLQAARGGPKPEDYGTYGMNRQGGWGTFVDPSKIPAQYQGQIMGGFYGDVENWDTSNPSITGAHQFGTDRYKAVGHSPEGGVRAEIDARSGAADLEAKINAKRQRYNPGDPVPSTGGIG